MASEKANELAGTLTTCPMVSSLSTPAMGEEFAPVIDTAVAPLLDALKEWYDAETSTEVSNDGDWHAFEAKVKALLRAWGRK